MIQRRGLAEMSTWQSSQIRPSTQDFVESPAQQQQPFNFFSTRLDSYVSRNRRVEESCAVAEKSRDRAGGEF